MIRIVPIILLYMRPPYIILSICLENMKAIGICKIIETSFAIISPPKYTKLYHQCSVKVRYTTKPNTNTTPISWNRPYIIRNKVLGYQNLGFWSANFSKSPSGKHSCNPTKEMKVVQRIVAISILMKIIIYLHKIKIHIKLGWIDSSLLINKLWFYTGIISSGRSAWKSRR